NREIDGQKNDHAHLLAPCVLDKQAKEIGGKIAASLTEQPRQLLFFGQTCAFVDKLSNKRRCDLRVISSSFDERERPSHGPRCDHQYDRGYEHQTQQKE